MPIATIETGISAIRTAMELTRALREALKTQPLKADEVSGRIGEIYDYIDDSQTKAESSRRHESLGIRLDAGLG